MNNVNNKISLLEFLFIIFISLIFIFQVFNIIKSNRIEKLDNLVKQNTIVFEEWLNQVHKNRLKGKSYKFKKCSTYNAGSLNNCFFNLTGRNKPLETYKNPFYSNNEKSIIFVFSNNPYNIIGESENCNKLDKNLEISDSNGDFQKVVYDWRGVILLQNLLHSDKLINTNNKLLLGYCNSESMFKIVSDKIIF